jgi:twitching motility protein PilT
LSRPVTDRVSFLLGCSDVADIHVTLGRRIWVRMCSGDLLADADVPPVIDEDLEEIATTVMGIAKGFPQKDLNMGFTTVDRTARVRAKVSRSLSRGQIFFRKLPMQPPPFTRLDIFTYLDRIRAPRHGVFLVSGPTGSGKSTLLASICQHYLDTRPIHLVTAEDPVEYLFSDCKGEVSQRQVGADVGSFGEALRASLREDPDVIMIGEVRDVETVVTMLVAAETGHMVLATVHAPDLAGMVERVIGMFPGNQQDYIAMRLSQVFIGGVSLRLVRSERKPGSRTWACEVGWINTALRSLIREGKYHQISAAVESHRRDGMITLRQHLRDLVGSGEVAREEALQWDPELFAAQGMAPPLAAD